MAYDESNGYVPHDVVTLNGQGRPHMYMLSVRRRGYNCHVNITEILKNGIRPTSHKLVVCVFVLHM